METISVGKQAVSSRRSFLRRLGAGALAGVAATAAAQTGRVPLTTLRDRRRDFRIDGPISREVLENYLARAITMAGLNAAVGNPAENIRMLTHVGGKFAGRAIGLWGDERTIADPGFLRRAREIAGRVHRADPEIVLQGAVFEIVSEEVDRVAVPRWVFEEFGEKPIGRTFRYRDMLAPDGRFVDHWGRGSSVPDITRPETKMWFFFLAASYIDVGMEALHFGQLELVGRGDPEHGHAWDLLQRVRGHAARHARRHWVICDAHVPSGGLVRHGRLLLDAHAFPMRPKEVAGSPQRAVLEVGYFDSIYGRSKGGIAPGGWKCEHLPYLVELDNFGASGSAGQASQASGPTGWVWGYDEIDWFARQTETCRNDWLRYAWNWLRTHDRSGFVEMPGMRCLHDGPPSAANGRRKIGYYFANRPGPACPDGFNQEETIRSIWRQDCTSGS